MGFYIDLSRISLDEYKEKLKASDLLPSRMVLKDVIDDNFHLIQDQHIQNVEELLNRLKTKIKCQEFAKQSGVDETYLTILVREIKSYRQKPVAIKDFPGINEATVSRLAEIGIKNTLQLFDKILTPQSRLELSSQTAIPEIEILTLAKLTDLSRIRWVNHTFAYVLLEAGYETSQKVARANYNELYEEVKKLNAERAIYKGHIGLHDMKLCVEAAKDVSFDIAFNVVEKR